jgi:hypothetical protein
LTEKCKCPICKGEVSKEARDHVFKEIGKLVLDPKYQMKYYEEDSK